MKKPVKVCEWKVIKLYSPSAKRWSYVNFESIDLTYTKWQPVAEWHSLPCFHPLINVHEGCVGEGVYRIDKKTGKVKGVTCWGSMKVSDKDYLTMYKAKNNRQLLKLFPTATLLFKQYGKNRKYPCGHAEYELVED